MCVGPTDFTRQVLQRCMGSFSLGIFIVQSIQNLQNQQVVFAQDFAFKNGVVLLSNLKRYLFLRELYFEFSLGILLVGTVA